MQSQAHYGLDFLSDQFVQHAVVVALVLSSYDPHHRLGLTLQGIPCRIDVSGLRVIYVEHVLYAQHRLEPVLYGAE